MAVKTSINNSFLSITGNAVSSTKATNDSLNQNIKDNYIKSISVSSKTIVCTKGSGTQNNIGTSFALMSNNHLLFDNGTELWIE